MFILGFIPDSEALLNHSKMGDKVMTEKQYFENHRKDLAHLFCPNCKEKGGLFLGFHSVGCYECFVYHGVEEIIEANSNA